MPQQEIAYFGIDLHKNSLTIAVLVSHENECREVVKLPNDWARIRKYFECWAQGYEIKACYEASSNGYDLYHKMNGEAFDCEVIAPGLIPRKPAEKRKTDVRDAKNLARLYRGGHLSVIHVPSKQEEAERSLVRCRHFMKKQQKRLKQVIDKYLQLRGYNYAGGAKRWNPSYMRWIKNLALDEIGTYVMNTYIAELDSLTQSVQELDRKIEELAQSESYKMKADALKTLRGVQTLTAMTLLTEIGDFRRFSHPGQLMSYLGLVPGEDSSGDRQRTLSITKAGNHECRRILVEAATHARYKPCMSEALKKRHQGQPPTLTRIARKAIKRLHHKYWRIEMKKGANKAKVAVAREMTGFVWALMNEVA